MLLRQRITKGVFKLPLKTQEAEKLILAALMGEIELRHGVYIPSITVDSNINTIAEWLTSTDRQFGMILCGKCGNGKTTLMRAVCTVINFLHIRDEFYNTTCSISIVTAKDVARMSKDESAKFRQLCKMRMLAVDDLGTEPSEVMDFGNISNPLVDLLETRYNDQNFTMITTNLTPEQLREKYGERVTDRFNEMMKKIVFTGDSYR